MVIGRQEEQAKLHEFYHSNEAEFAAIWGRRRVGKTYLIKKTYEAKARYFLKVMGEKGGALSSQLENFSKALSATFYSAGISIKPATSWKEAFEVLTATIKSICGNKKVVLFFDELPWLAAGKSKILSAIDYYWNNIWVDMPNIKLIVCGSAASWMIDNIVSNRGGLHNRLTLKIRLEPLTFKQTKEFLIKKNHSFNDQQILQIYLILGGIPFYLKLLEKKLSVSQNINELCFNQRGALLNEFQELYSSLFNHPEIYIEIVTTLAKYPQGLTRAKLTEKLKLSSDGGSLNRKLKALEEAGFIHLQEVFTPKKTEKKLKLIDEYTSFYLNWIKPKISIINNLGKIDNYWETISKQSRFIAWRGLSFEKFCFKHLYEIIKSLNIASSNKIGPWSYTHKTLKKNSNDESGTQIDLFVDRDDDTVTLCEIKYTNACFTITKKYAQELKSKITIFREKTKTKKQIVFCFISTNGLTRNTYSQEIVAWDITLNDFLK